MKLGATHLKIIAIVGVAIFGLLSYPEQTKAQANPPGYLNVEDFDPTPGVCRIYKNSDTEYINKFTTTHGGINKTWYIKYWKKNITRKGEGDGGEVFFDASAYTQPMDVYQLKGKSESDNPFPDPDRRYYFAMHHLTNTGDSERSVKTLFISANNSDMNNSGTTEVFETGHPETTLYGQRAHGSSDSGLGKYIEWFASMDHCIYSDSPPRDDTNFQARNATGTISGGNATMALFDPKASETWYYVAQGNYRSCDGAMFRSSDGSKYVLVGSGGKTVVCTFKVGDQDWDTTNSSTDCNVNWCIPNYTMPPAASNVIKIAPAYADFAEALKQITTDDFRSGKELTIEINLDDPHGPYSNKEHWPMTSSFTGTDPAGELHNYVYIFSASDMDIFNYGSGITKEEHIKHLIQKITVCTHKIIESKSNTPAAGMEQLTILDPTTGKFISSTTSGIKDGGSDGGKLVWKPSVQPLKISVSFGSQPCGGVEDRDAVDRTIAPIGDAAKNFLKDTILKALTSLAQLIQNFIILVVQWMITVATSYVPI